ncbi:MAG: TetR/AcrR family transcriptional regulator [Microbacteriaceae bacterium]
MPDEPRRGRPPRTSRAAILDATLQVGLDRATVSGVAERLGVDQSTLYRHVDGVDDMLDAATALAVSRSEWPDIGDDWAEYLRDCARAMWAMFSSTPGLAQRLRSMKTVPDEMVEQSFRVVEHLTNELGFEFQEAALIVDTIGDLTADSFLTVESLDRAVGDGLSYRDQVLQAMADAGGVVPHPAADAYLDAMRYAMGEQGAPSSWWLDKVDLVIDGVRLRWERRSR